LVLLTCLAALSLWRSALPVAWALPASLAVVAGGWLQWRREGRVAPVSIVIAPTGAGAYLVDGRVAFRLRLEWFGPLACLSWRDSEGRQGRRVFWPDNLPPALRRELRLAVSNTNTRGRAKEWHHSVP